MLSSAERLGWIRFIPAQNGHIYRNVRTIGAPLGGGGPDPEDVATLQRDVAGRHLELLLVHSGAVQTDKGKMTPGRFGCHVNDYEAAHPIDGSIARDWAGREPLKQVATPAEDDSASRKRLNLIFPIIMDWSPGVLKNSSDTHIAFTPKETFMDLLGGMAGVMISSNWDEAKVEQ